MSKLGSKEEIIAAIQSHFENIQSGALTADDMESLVELTRELHERALILRYKSYEEKVFGVRPQAATEEIEQPADEEAPAEEPEETVSEAPETAQHSMGFEEIETEMLQAEAMPIPDEPVFDFDMFEKAEADIFTPLSETESTTSTSSADHESNETDANNADAEPVTADVQPVETEAQQIANEIEESPVTVSEKMPIADTPQETEPVRDEQPSAPVQETPAPEETEPEMPLPEELAIMNEPVIIPEKPAQAESDIFSKVNTAPVEDSLSARLVSNTKLHTLAGAFGLNEKLQCIRELFKGSSEAFNQAIETLDQQDNFASAKRVLAQYAQQNSWNLESNLTAEFIQKVERRFL